MPQNESSFYRQLDFEATKRRLVSRWPEEESIFRATSDKQQSDETGRITVDTLGKPGNFILLYWKGKGRIVAKMFTTGLLQVHWDWREDLQAFMKYMTRDVVDDRDSICLTWTMTREFLGRTHYIRQLATFQDFFPDECDIDSYFWRVHANGLPYGSVDEEIERVKASQREAFNLDMERRMLPLEGGIKGWTQRICVRIGVKLFRLIKRRSIFDSHLHHIAREWSYGTLVERQVRLLVEGPSKRKPPLLRSSDG